MNEEAESNFFAYLFLVFFIVAESIIFTSCGTVERLCLTMSDSGYADSCIQKEIEDTNSDTQKAVPIEISGVYDIFGEETSMKVFFDEHGNVIEYKIWNEKVQ